MTSIPRKNFTADLGLAELTGFCCLLDERSVSRAALAMGLGQPSMSKMLARLRRRWSDPLFVLSSGRMVPTATALALEPEVRGIVEAVKRLERPQPTFTPATSEDRFAVMLSEPLERILLPALVVRLFELAPRLQVEFRPPNRWHYAKWLESGEIDFVLGWADAPPPALRSRQLFSDRLVAMTRRDHPGLRDGKLTYERYVTLPQVITGRTTIAAVLDERLAAKGHKLNIVLRVNSFSVLPHIVGGTDLITTLPLRIASPMAAQQALATHDVPLRLPRHQNAIYWHERVQDSKAHRWFRDVVVSVAERA